MSLFSWLRGSNGMAGSAEMGGPRRRKASRQPAPRCRPRLEVLEDRLCPSLGFGWAHHAGSAGDPEDGLDVAADSASNVYVTGRFTGTADFAPGITLTSNANGLAAFVAKYSPTGALLWAKSVGGQEGDSILIDGSGNVVVAGFFIGTTVFGAGDPNQTTLTTASSSDIFLAKLDPATGNLLWVRQYGGPNYAGIDADGGHQLVMDRAGNLYLTGDFSGDVAFGPSTLSSDFHLSLNVNGSSLKDGERFTINDGTRSATFEYDNNNSVSTGDIPITFTSQDGFGTIETATAQAINNANASGQTNARAGGEIVTRAVSVGYTPIDPAAPALAIGNGYSAFVAKLAGDTGDVLWAKNNWGPQVDDEHAQSVAVNDTAVYAAARAFHAPSLGVITKFGVDGSGPLWEESLQGANATSEGGVNALGLDSAGNLLAAGVFAGKVDFDPGPGTYSLASARNSSGSSADVFVWKLDANGNFVWAKAMGGKGNEIAFDLAVDGAGSVYTTGYFGDRADFDPGKGTYTLSPAGSADIFVSKLDSNGNFVWAGAMGGATFDSGWAINLDAARNVFVTGTFTGSADFDPTSGTSTLTSAGYRDIFVAKLTQSSPLLAAGGALSGNSPTPVLTPQQITPLLTTALARWQAAGEDTSRPGRIDLRITDLPGATLGLASGHTIWLDDNAAGVGWFVNPAPADNSQFTPRANQAEKESVDLMTVWEWDEFGQFIRDPIAVTVAVS